MKPSQSTGKFPQIEAFLTHVLFTYSYVYIMHVNVIVY